MTSAAQLEWRYQVSNIAHDKHLTRRRVENCGWINPTVRAGDDHYPGSLAFGQFRPALSLIGPAAFPESLITGDQISKISHGVRDKEQGWGWQVFMLDAKAGT